MILAEYDAEDTMRGFYEDGRAEGRQEGYEAREIDLIKRMFQNGINPEVIAQSADIPEDEPQEKKDEAEKQLLRLIDRYKVNVIALGNGTASRESEMLVSELIKKNKLEVKYVIVSESGASVYSASEEASKEFPDMDVTLRSAVSIARRLQDPLAELVKIDPKSIGVGQYQHDIPQNELESLCALYGGQFLDFTPKSSIYINPMEIPEEVFLDEII